VKSNNNKKILISGMIRSGSTLISRIMNAHSKIRIGSDVLLFIYKLCLYGELKSQSLVNKNFDEFSLSSGFFDKTYSDIVTLIGKTNLDIEIKSQEKILIQSRLESTLYMEPGLVVNMNNILLCQTYGELIDCLYSVIRNNGDTEYVGTKEAYCDDFKPWMDARYPNSKFIHIIRNPLAVYASIKNFKKNYPLIYVLHHWRKHVAHALHNESKHDALIILYEDLCKFPEEISKRICDHLDLKFEDSMLLHDNWKTLSDEKWNSNSSYNFESKKSIYAEDLNKWEGASVSKEGLIAGYLCYEEIRKYYPKLFGDKKPKIGRNIFIKNLSSSKTQRVSYPDFISDLTYNEDHLSKIWDHEEKRNKLLVEEDNLTSSSATKFFINKEAYKSLLFHARSPKRNL